MARAGPSRTGSADAFSVRRLEIRFVAFEFEIPEACRAEWPRNGSEEVTWCYWKFSTSMMSVSLSTWSKRMVRASGETSNAGTSKKSDFSTGEIFEMLLSVKLKKLIHGFEGLVSMK